MKKKSYIKNLTKRYILFPAQFWEHKNHDFLIKVGKIIKKKNINIKIYLCGKTDNYKNKDYFNIVNYKIKKFKLNKIFKNFGEVSLHKLNKLQKNVWHL